MQPKMHARTHGVVPLGACTCMHACMCSRCVCVCICLLACMCVHIVYLYVMCVCVCVCVKIQVFDNKVLSSTDQQSPASMSKPASCCPEVLHTSDPTAETVSSNSEKEAVLPDFSTLPDVVWVAVLQMLTLPDRYHLSLTCSKLYSLFSHPSTWKIVILELPGEHDLDFTMTRGRGLILPWQRVMVEKYGRCFQDLTLCLETFELHPECYGVLRSLAKTGGLRRCVLDICDVPGDQIFHDLSRSKGPSVYTLMEDLSCLSGNLHLDVTCSWVNASMYNDVFRCSRSDLRCKHLHSFAIPYSDDTEEELVEHTCLGDALRYTQTPTAVLVSRFPCLQHLTLNGCHFSDELLYALADMSSRRCQLRTITGEFKVFDYIEEEDVCDLSSQAWNHLTLSSPHLVVFCYFQRPYGLDKVFKPEAPLVSIEIDSLGEKLISPSKLLSFCVDHCDTLVSLKYSVEEEIEVGDDLYPDELPLVSIAIDCPYLVRLEYGGLIHRADVIKLAEMDRKWETFAIDKNYVLRDDQAEWEVSLTEEDAAMLEEVRQAVSQCLGYHWEFYH